MVKHFIAKILQIKAIVKYITKYISKLHLETNFKWKNHFSGIKLPYISEESKCKVAPNIYANVEFFRKFLC